MITIFGWVAAICLTVFVVAFACASVIEYSPLGTLLRPGALAVASERAL